jgi:hypothetical protein
MSWSTPDTIGPLVPPTSDRRLRSDAITQSIPASVAAQRATLVDTYPTLSATKLNTSDRRVAPASRRHQLADAFFADQATVPTPLFGFIFPIPPAWRPAARTCRPMISRLSGDWRMEGTRRRDDGNRQYRHASRNPKNGDNHHRDDHAITSRHLIGRNNSPGVPEDAQSNFMANAAITTATSSTIDCGHWDTAWMIAGSGWRSYQPPQLRSNGHIDLTFALPPGAECPSDAPRYFSGDWGMH